MSYFGAVGVQGAVSGLLMGQGRSLQNPNDLFSGGTVGGLYGTYLRGLYSGPVTSTPWFKSAAGALRTSIDQEGGAAGEQLAAATNAGGTYDSGARIASLQGINRAKLSAYSQGLSQIMNQIEMARISAAAPFLSARLNASGQYNQALLGEDQLTQQKIQEHARQDEWGVNTVASMFGGGGGGGMGGAASAFGG